MARCWPPLSSLLPQAMYRGEPAIDRAGGGDGNRNAGDPRRARSPRRCRASAAAADLPEDADSEEESYGEEEEEDDEEAYVVFDVQPRRTPWHDSTARVCCDNDSCRCRAAQKRPGRRRRGSGNTLRIFFIAAAAAFLTLAVSPGMKQSRSCRSWRDCSF